MLLSVLFIVVIHVNLMKAITKAKKKKKAKFSINKMPQVPEGLSKGNEHREACQCCGLFKSCAEPFATPDITDGWTGKLLLLSEPLGQKARNIINGAIHQAGYSDDDVAQISPLRCSSNKKPKMSQIRACRPFLLKIIEVLKPKYVLGLGPVALRALTNKSDANITKARGKEIKL